MLLTIHNLPSNARYADVKTLLQEKCGLTEVIFDNLVNEGKSKKVTVGLTNEEDGAIVVRKLNGLFINGQQLYIEDRRRTTADQPYRQASFEPDSNTMPPAMAPPALWNQNVTPYMQPMPIDQTVVKMEKDGDNEATEASKETEDSFTNPKQCKVEPGSFTNVKVKTEPDKQTHGETNTNDDITDCPDMQLNSIKTELPDETMPAAFSKNVLTKTQLKIPKEEYNPEESASKHVYQTQSLSAKKDHTPFKEEKYVYIMAAPIKVHTPLKEEKSVTIKPTPKNNFSKKLRKKDNQVCHYAASTIARKIMGPSFNKCGKNKHRIRCPGHGLENLICKRIENVVFQRLRDMFVDTLYSNPKDQDHLVQCYIKRFDTSDHLLYNQIYESSVKDYKPPTPPKPKYDTTRLPTLMPREWQVQYMIDKVESERKKHEKQD